jgi:hypothetical protein
MTFTFSGVLIVNPCFSTITQGFMVNIAPESNLNYICLESNLLTSSGFVIKPYALKNFPKDSLQQVKRGKIILNEG